MGSEWFGDRLWLLSIICQKVLYVFELGAVRIFVLHDNSDKISEHLYEALSEFYNWVVHKFTKNILSELLIIVIL